jgi:hypothetical protein
MPVKDGSGYDFVQDLSVFNITQTQVDLPQFTACGNKFFMRIKKREGDPRYSCYLRPCDSSSISPGTIHYRFDLVKKLDDEIVDTITGDRVFYNSTSGYGRSDWIWTIRDHVLKVKVWIEKSFADFVKIPASFAVCHTDFLFDKMSSNFSFKVGDPQNPHVPMRLLSSDA